MNEGPGARIRNCELPVGSGISNSSVVLGTCPDRGRYRVGRVWAVFVEEPVGFALEQDSLAFLQSPIRAEECPARALEPLGDPGPGKCLLTQTA